jgi:hypothetical protein
MFQLNHMILLLTISTHIHVYITKYIMINIHHIVKDSFKPTQVIYIATNHFYPKHLFKRVVKGKGNKILVMSLKR